MTKTDDVLLELCKIFSTYIKSVFPFQYKNKTYRLISNYVALPYMKCDVCGNYPISEVSIIESSTSERLRLGNDCIDYLTGRDVSGWFKSYRKRRETIMSNRNYIDQISLIVGACGKNALSFQITDDDVEKLRIMLEQMCNGLNPTTHQVQIAECYIRKKAMAINASK